MKTTFTLKVNSLFSLLAFALLLTFCNSSVFAVAPAIISASPMAGVPGTTVVINGTGFNDTAARNIVHFGNMQAVVNIASPTSLTVVVPLGAQYAAISVMNMTTRLTAISADYFAPDYDNSCVIPGTYTFKPRVDFAITGTAAPGPYYSAIGDIDGDGKADLVVCTYQAYTAGLSYLYVYRNIGTQGQLAYAPPVLCTTANGGTKVKLADLDGDGKLDIIVACTGSGRVACNRNKSTPGTISIAPVWYQAFSSGSPDIVVADFDGDGKLDIAGSAYVDNKVEIFRNIITSIPTDRFTTNGTFTTYHVDFPVGNYCLGIAAGDLDGDNKPDIITSNGVDGAISILRNVSATDTFMFEPAVDYTVGIDCRSLKLMDVNGDNKPEIVVANLGSDNLTLFQNNVTTTPFTLASFSPGITISTGAGSAPATVDFGDFDGDGKTDLAVTSSGNNNVTILKNNYTSGALGAATFTMGSTYSTGTGSLPAGITVGDMDGDNKPDIVTGNIGNNTISIFKNTFTPDTVSITAGTDTVCVANTLILTNNHCAAGSAYWSVTNGHATIVGGAGVLDTNAVLTGISAGYDTVVCAVVSLFDTNYVQYVVRILPVADTGMITGLNDVCVSSTITLANIATGGIWSSSNTAVATVDAAGVVTGVAAGSVNISYTASSLSCGPLSATHLVTVNALPDAGNITGANGVCTGSSITLTASLPGGTWINKYPTVALSVPAGTTNVLTGLVVGADTILYVATTTLCGSDTALHAVGVVATGISLPIAGADSVCSGASTTLTNGAPGGTWTSSNTAIASVDAITGMVTGAATGTATITYTVAYGCGPIVATHNVTVNPLPNAGTITGADSVCSAATINLTDAATGGVWSSAATSVATVSATGVLTGVSTTLATATISYTSATFSCGTQVATHLVTVKALPNAGTITGADSVCSGGSIALTDAAPGGVWSSAATGIATVSATGLVTGVATALSTTTISYTSSTFSCGSVAATHAVTVKPLPNAGTITGADSVCSGATINLADAAPGGVWSSGATGIATVSATGVVTGVSAVLATTTISYTSATFSCGTLVATHSVTVKALPNAGAITGADSVCSGATIALANATGSSTGVWSSLSTAIATVTTTGVVTGVSAALATTTISFTVGSFSCGSASATHPVTVKALPNAGTISGADSVCNGATTVFTDASVGGTWSSAATGIATVSTTGTVGGASATLASTIISYTVSTFSCGNAVATHPITVKATPTAGTIVGSDSVCSAATVALTNPTATPGGVWSSASTTIATVSGTGVVTGVSTGLATTTITYTTSSFSCGAFTAAHPVTVKPLPNAGTIAGPTSVCNGATIVLTDAAPGGVWSSAATGVATVSATGTVGGASAATTTISYAVSTFSCGSAFATYAITVNALPVSGTISGAASVCEGATTPLATTGTGGTWSSSNTAAATISATGVVGGVAAGTTTISYTATNACGTSTTTWALTVNPLPLAGTITGITSVCEGATTALADAAPGGTWTSGNTSIATVAGGTVGGAATGTALISYTVTNGCGTAFDTAEVTVNALPHAGTISGISFVCEGSSTTLSSTLAGGTWISGNTLIATVSATGGVGGVTGGSLSISYAVTNSCGTDIATFPFTVTPLPHAGIISGTASICPGTSTALSSTTPGGVWSSMNTAVATITSGGVAGGVAPGSVTISYTYVNSCGSDATAYSLTVIPFPVAGTISGPLLVCPGSTISLTSTVPGGAWLSMNTAVATVTTPGGIVGGASAGNAVIRYTVSNICGSALTSVSITVNPIVVPAVTITLSPNDTVCEGTLVTFTPTAVNGGSAPIFIWTIFGLPVDTGATYTYAPANFDNIGVVLVSSAPCPVPGADTSTSISMLVRPSVTPYVSIVSSVPGDLVSFLGELVTFFATASYGGTAPTFQWYLNGVPVSGATSTSYSTVIESEDTVYCVMTSNLECITTPLDTSDIKIIYVGTLGIGQATTINDIKMYPNPNDGSFTVSGTINASSNNEITYQVIDMMGKTIFTDHSLPKKGEIEQQIHLAENIPPGNYILRIVNGDESKIVHFTISN